MGPRDKREDDTEFVVQDEAHCAFRLAQPIAENPFSMHSSPIAYFGDQRRTLGEIKPHFPLSLEGGGFAP
jgi:hypothetical protein